MLWMDDEGEWFEEGVIQIGWEWMAEVWNVKETKLLFLNIWSLSVESTDFVNRS